MSETSAMRIDRSRLTWMVGSRRRVGVGVTLGSILGSRSPSSTSIPMSRSMSIVCAIRGSCSFELDEDGSKRVKRSVIEGGVLIPLGGFRRAAWRSERPARRMELSNSFGARLGLPSESSSSSSDSVKYESISRNSAKRREFLVLFFVSAKYQTNEQCNARVHANPSPSTLSNDINLDSGSLARATSRDMLGLVALWKRTPDCHDGWWGMQYLVPYRYEVRRIGGQGGLRST